MPPVSLLISLPLVIAGRPAEAVEIRPQSRPVPYVIAIVGTSSYMKLASISTNSTRSLMLGNKS
jgi:hypothetical protein